MTWVDHGQAALAELAGRRVDAMILDLGLGDMDGLDVCAKARESGFAGGILICTARGDELDRVVGLDNGADDYLAKPFSLAELQARVRALLRRTVPAALPQSAPAAGLAIDRPARRVTHAGTTVNLASKEDEVLSLLAERPGAVVERDRLMTEIWDENWYGSTKTFDVTVGRLRKKLEELGAQERVVTVRGVGFRLEGGDVGG